MKNKTLRNIRVKFPKNRKNYVKNRWDKTLDQQ